MHAPKDQGGQDMYSTGVYRKIVPMELLEFTQGMADKDGNIIDPVHVGMPNFPKEMRLEVIFESKKCDMTELTINHYDWPVSDGGQMYVYALAGWHQSMDKLAESLK